MHCKSKNIKRNLQEDKQNIYKIIEIIDLYQGNTMRNGKVLELQSFHTAHG